MLPPARRDGASANAFCGRSAVVSGFHVFHARFSDAKLLVVAADAGFVLAKHSGLDVRFCENQCVRLQLLRAFVSAKHSGLDVRFCENQGVRLQLLRALYRPSHFLGQLRNCYFSIKSMCSVAAFACFVWAKPFPRPAPDCYFSIKSTCSVAAFACFVSAKPFPRPAPELLIPY